MSKETYYSGTQTQKGTYYRGKRDLLGEKATYKRDLNYRLPELKILTARNFFTTKAKETYYRGKRDPIYRQKKPELR